MRSAVVLLIVCSGLYSFVCSYNINSIFSYFTAAHFLLFLIPWYVEKLLCCDLLLMGAFLFSSSMDFADNFLDLYAKSVSDMIVANNTAI